MNYWKIVLWVACDVVVSVVIYGATVLANRYLNGLGPNHYSNWINTIGLVALILVARYFSRRVLDEWRRTQSASSRAADIDGLGR